MSRANKSTNKILPHQSQQQNGAILVGQQTITSSPFPPPEQCEVYETLCPGFLASILEMTKEEQSHVQEINKGTMEMNKALVKSEISCRKLGLVFAFIIAMVALIGGIYLILKGFINTGFTIVASALVAIVGSFIYGSRGLRAKAEEKENQS